MIISEKVRDQIVKEFGLYFQVMDEVLSKIDEISSRDISSLSLEDKINLYSQYLSRSQTTLGKSTLKKIIKRISKLNDDNL